MKRLGCARTKITLLRNCRASTTCSGFGADHIFKVLLWASARDMQTAPPLQLSSTFFEANQQLFSQVVCRCRRHTRASIAQEQHVQVHIKSPLVGAVAIHIDPLRVELSSSSPSSFRRSAWGHFGLEMFRIWGVGVGQNCRHTVPHRRTSRLFF